MAALDASVRRALARIGDPTIALPAMYDQLSWHERAQVREDYILLQRGLCWHCSEPLEGPPRADVAELWLDPRLWGPEFLRHPIHLHHCHRTGLTIGATHARCNAVLAQYHGV